MDLETPLSLLWGLPVLGLIAVICLRSRGRRVLVMLPLAGSAALLVLSLGGPVLRKGRDEHRVILLLDRSLSVRLAERGRESGTAESIDILRSRLRPSDFLGAVEFAGETQSVLPLGRVREARTSPADLPAPLPLRTDIAAALRTASALLPPGGEIILLSDGRENRGDAVRAGAGLLLRGQKLRVVPTAPPPPGDAGVSALRSTTQPLPGAEARIEAVVFSRHPGLLTVFFVWEGRRVHARELDLSAGERRRVTWESPPLPQGLTRIRVEVATGGEDPIPENNAMELPLRARGRKKILYVAKDYKTRIFPEILGRTEGAALDVERRPPFALPGRASGLAPYDAVVVEDVPASRLSSAQMKALSSFVRNAGGGLLLLGGEESFGPGGHFDTPLEALSPVRSDPRESKPLHMTVLLDASGSMEEDSGEGGTKLGLAVEALQTLLRRLRKGDLLRVVPFASRPHPDARLAAAGGDAPGIGKLGRRLDALAAGALREEGTSIYAALSWAAANLPAGKEAQRHVLLYSDGLETVTPGDYDALRSRFAAEDVTLSCVVTAPSMTPDVERFCRTRLVSGGRFYHVRRFADLRGYFLKDYSSKARDLVRRVRTPVTVERASFRAFRPPPVEAYVRTGLRKSQGARQVLAAGKDPLLAQWRAGLGRVWAFTSSLERNWADGWLVERRGMTALWTAVLSDLLAGRRGAGAVELFDVGDALEITATVRDDGAFRNGASLHARVLRNLDSVGEVPLEQTGPGRYEGRFAFEEADAGGGAAHYGVLVTDRRGEEEVVGEAEIVVHGTSEVRGLGPDLAALRSVASASGSLLADLSAYRRPLRSRRASGTVRISWLLCAAALVLFLLYLAVKERR
jgi:hypothetical protein